MQTEPIIILLFSVAVSIAMAIRLLPYPVALLLAGLLARNNFKLTVPKMLHAVIDDKFRLFRRQKESL